MRGVSSPEDAVSWKRGIRFGQYQRICFPTRPPISDQNVTTFQSERVRPTAMSRTNPEDIHPQFGAADIIIVDQDDVRDAWPGLQRGQTLLSEDGYTKGCVEFNLIGPGDPDLSLKDAAADDVGRVTQVGYHVLHGEAVLDLRDKRGQGFGDGMYGLTP